MQFYLLRLVCDKTDGGIGLLTKPTQRSFQALLWKTKAPLQDLQWGWVFCSKTEILFGVWPLWLQAKYPCGCWKLLFLFLDTFWDILNFPVLYRDRAKSLTSAWGAVQEGGPSTRGSTVSSPGGTHLLEMGSSPRPVTNVVFLHPQPFPWVSLYFLF